MCLDDVTTSFPIKDGFSMLNLSVISEFVIYRKKSARDIIFKMNTKYYIFIVLMSVLSYKQFVSAAAGENGKQLIYIQYDIRLVC